MLFLQEYNAAKFTTPFCDNHRAYIARLQDIILHGGQQCIAMPRSGGKTVISKGAAQWALAYGHRRFAVVVSATKTEAVAYLEDLKYMLTAPTFAEDFPEIAYPLQRLKGSALLARGQLYYDEPTLIKWGEADLKLPSIAGSPSSGAQITTVGINGAIRGRASGDKQGRTIRPDLILIDDPQKDDDALNPKRVEKIISKIKRTIRKLCEDGTTPAMVMTVTVMEPSDAAEHFLDHDVNPQWQGLRFKMVTRFPDSMDVWLKTYGPLRFNDARKANNFYCQNRALMDAGAIVDWPERYDPEHEASRLQRAMNELIDDADSFYSESQNEPRGRKKDTILVSERELRSRVNGYDRGVVPNEAGTITAFIDVHNDILYYVVTAFADDRTGYVIDYGSFPEQVRDHYFKNAPGNETLKTLFSTLDVEGRIALGVERLTNQIITEPYRTEDGVVIPISRLLIDTGYKRSEIEQAIRLVNSPVVAPSKGRGIRAAQKPMAVWTREPGDRKGHYWIQKITRGRSYKTYFIDTNYWKSEVHNSFSLGVGDRTSLSLWGRTPERHRMFSQHCNAENVILNKAGERELHEWQAIPGADNHLFDCVVGCLAAASTLGINKPDVLALATQEAE